MAIEGRYTQTADTSHGCHHEKLVTIVDDGWRMIQCTICLKRWDSETGRSPSAAEVRLVETEAQIDAIVEDMSQMLQQMTERTRKMIETAKAARERWKGAR